MADTIRFLGKTYYLRTMVKYNYIGRLIVYSVEIFLAASVFHYQKAPVSYWIFIFSAFLFCPTTAFIVSILSKHPKKTEFIIMSFEAVLLGIFMVLVKFNQLTCIAFIVINFLFYAMIGGPVFFIRSIIILLLSVFFSGLLITDFAYVPESSLLTQFFSIILIVVSITLIGLSTHITNNTLSRSRKDIRKKQKMIMNSLEYARKIQHGLLTNPSEIQHFFPDSFVIWEPRDVVGGDIYFTHLSDSQSIISVIDCTGHGIPGAFLTMIASTALQRIIRDEEITDPATILKRLNYIVKTSLYQDSDHATSDDGMDIAVCEINTEKNTLTIASARVPVLIVSNDSSRLIKGDRHSIGYRKSNLNHKFETHTIPVTGTMYIYMFSDGLTSQTGGDRGLMLGTRNVASFLESVSKEPFDVQKNKILELYHSYRNHHEPKDDLTLIGFSVSESPEKSL